MVFTARGLFVTKTLAVALTTYLVYATMEVARAEARSLGIAYFLILGAILARVAFMVWRGLTLTLSALKQPR